MFDNFWNFQGGGGVTASSLKWKIRRGRGVLYDIPSVVGVWIFSGTTQSEKHRFAEKREIVFLVFHTNVSKFSRKRRLHFTDKYMRNKNLKYAAFFARLQFSNLIDYLFYLAFLVCNS